MGNALFLLFLPPLQPVTPIVWSSRIEYVSHVDNSFITMEQNVLKLILYAGHMTHQMDSAAAAIKDMY